MSTSRIRLSAYLILIVSLVVSVRLIRDILKLRQVDQRIKSAEAELLAAQQKQLELKEELLKVNSEAWQEEQFRNALKMAKPNEVVVVVPEEISKASTLTETEITPETELPNWQKWWQLFAP